MKWVMMPIRAVLGAGILSLNWIFTPKSVVREPAEQAKIDAQTSELMLYQLVSCPFCVKVRRAIKRLGIQVTLRDIARDPSALAELLAGGKLDQAPCLKITAAGDSAPQWMYESSEIVDYLESRFGPSRKS